MSLNLSQSRSSTINPLLSVARQRRGDKIKVKARCGRTADRVFNDLVPHVFGEVVVTILQTPLYTRSAILLGNHKRFWCSVLSCDDLLPPSTYTRSAIIFGKPVDNGFAALSADEKGWWASSSAIAGKTSNGFVERPRCADMWGLP